jgi:hypothetical protein
VAQIVSSGGHLWPFQPMAICSIGQSCQRLDKRRRLFPRGLESRRGLGFVVEAGEEGGLTLGGELLHLLFQLFLQFLVGAGIFIGLPREIGFVFIGPAQRISGGDRLDLGGGLHVSDEDAPAFFKREQQSVRRRG